MTSRVITYGEGMDVDLRVEQLPADPPELEARVWVDGSETPVQLHLSVPPRHNLLNAAAALGVARALDLPLEVAVEALGTYGGVHRRFERKGEVGGARFVDDYAIHPTEIASVVEAARAEGGRVVAVFQPHRYSRTAAMWRELGESLAGADMVVITDVYAAWEEPIPGVTGKLVVDALAEAAPGKRIVYLPRRADVGPFIARVARPGDRVVTLGAGDITMVADESLGLDAGGGGVSDDRLARAETILRAAAGTARSHGIPPGAPHQLPPRRARPPSTWRPNRTATSGQRRRPSPRRGFPGPIIGKGSNLLVSDAGFPGLGAAPGQGLPVGGARGLRGPGRRGDAPARPGRGGAVARPRRARVRGGHPRHARRRGADERRGPPGSMDRVVRWVDVFSIPESSRTRLAAAEAGFVYRRSALPPGSIVVEAGARPAPRRAGGDPRGRWRRPGRGAGRPSRWPSPTAGASSRTPRATTRRAWSRRPGAKGMSVGLARVSEKHANFVVAAPGATAADVWELIGRVQRRVEERFGVSLEREVQLVGEFDGSAV